MQFDQALIIRIARESITNKIVKDEDWFPDISEEKFSNLRQKQGAFTTIYNPDHSLRGCIGIPYPNYPLAHSIAISARNSASKDPRFPKLSLDELDKIYIDVEVLSIIEEIKFVDENDLLAQIDVGRHGLIVKYNSNSGLLLPKVGARYNWDSLEFVKKTCHKAGLPQDAYTYEDINFFKFTSKCFSEKIK